MKKEKETSNYKPLKIICETALEEDVFKAISKESSRIARLLETLGFDYTTTKTQLDGLK